MRNLDIATLRSLQAVAEYGTVTRAAESLNMTQSALSMQMKRLEELLEKFGDSSRETERYTAFLKDKAWAQLGSSGSGNHFVEFGLFEPGDPALGLEPGQCADSTSLTTAATRPPSARPATSAWAAFITRPICGIPVAPVDATARATTARSSSSPSCAGR